MFHEQSTAQRATLSVGDVTALLYSHTLVKTMFSCQLLISLNKLASLKMLVAANMVLATMLLCPLLFELCLQTPKSTKSAVVLFSSLLIKQFNEH